MSIDNFANVLADNFGPEDIEYLTNNHIYQLNETAYIVKKNFTYANIKRSIGDIIFYDTRRVL